MLTGAPMCCILSSHLLLNIYHVLSETSTSATNSTSDVRKLTPVYTHRTWVTASNKWTSVSLARILLGLILRHISCTFWRRASHVDQEIGVIDRTRSLPASAADDKSNQNMLCYLLSATSCAMIGVIDTAAPLYKDHPQKYRVVYSYIHLLQLALNTGSTSRLNPCWRTNVWQLFMFMKPLFIESFDCNSSTHSYQAGY